MGNDFRVSPNVILAVMALASLAAASAMLPMRGPAQSDFTMFLLPWMDEIRMRGLASLSAEFSAYSPPYIYLLNVASLIEPAVGTVAAVKLVNLPFVVGSAFGVGAIVSTVRGDPVAGKIATAVAFVVPTLLVNAFAWGQADSIFTCFLVWFVAFVLRERWSIAAIMFGLALSFKLQAMFLSPFLLYLLLSGQMRLRAFLLIPLTYAVMMVPAALAGRPWPELLGVYHQQTHYMQGLSFNVPSPWYFLSLVLTYDTALIAGLLFGLAVAIMIVAGSLRTQPSPSTTLLTACLCAAVMPYVLPNMTARYFFVADILSVALAFTRPTLWPAAILIQLGSLLAYLAYFTGIGTAHVALFPMTFGVLILVLSWSARIGEAKGPINALRGFAWWPWWRG